MTTLEFISKDQEVHSLLLDSIDNDDKFYGMYIMTEQERRYNLLRESYQDDNIKLYFNSVTNSIDICATIYNVSWFKDGQGDFQYITSFPLSSKSISFSNITNTKFKLGKSYLIEIEPYEPYTRGTI